MKIRVFLNACVMSLLMMHCPSQSKVTHGYCPPKLTPGCQCQNGTVSVNCSGKDITELPVDVPNVVLFTLRGGSVEVIDKVPFKDLISLTLEDNHIKYIKDNAFEQLNKTKNLYLRNNEISGLTRQTFAGLKSLNTVTISLNPLHFLRRGVFSHLHMPHLKEIRMEESSLYEIEGRSFALLKELVYLNASYNRLRVLPQFHILDELNHLVTIDFSGNLIERIAGSGLGNVQHLQSLLLSKNHIKVITYHDMHGLEDSLRTLDLSDNEIHFVEAAAFAGMEKLEQLNLNNNKIRSLYWEELPWNVLNKITFSGNPWHCSCNNSWLIGDSYRIVRVYNDHNNTRQVVFNV